MSLDRIGINSLVAVNQWIGVINGNLQSANRTGYKTTRANFTDGLGINSVAGNLQIPPSTLTVQSTQVEWGQGSVVNSDASTHFALNGDGFFVLHNESSNKYYVSRDGEFHWDHEGYLVNSAGLKVVSAGRDYIRFDPQDQSDIFHKDGYSAELDTYGNKNFLLLDFANRDNLRMSQYGSTVFEIDGNLTTRVKNDFSIGTDGITFSYDDPNLISIVDDPGFVYGSDAVVSFGDNGPPLNITIDAGTTIEDIVNAINAHPSGNVFANFDLATDKLSIENTVATGGDNRIQFGGVNGAALAAFFKLDRPYSQLYSTAANDSRFIQSQDDIDNSDENALKDITNGPNIFAPPPAFAPAPSTYTTVPIQDLVTGYEAVYLHNKQAGYVQSDATTAVRGGGSMIISEASSTDQFDVVMDLKVTNGGAVVFGFGQSDPQSFNSGGYELLYNPATGDVSLRQRPEGYGVGLSPVVIGGPINIGAIGTGANSAALDAAAASRVAIQLDRNQQISISINGGPTATFSVSSAGRQLSGFLTLRNVGNILRAESIYADLKNTTNTQTTGEMVSVGISDIGNVELSNTVHGKRPRTFVTQNALEASEASLTEYIPMLSIAQKVFSSISKIISTHNLITDDLNTLIR